MTNNSETGSGFRLPSDFERSLFGRMMSRDFPGRNELQAQLQHVEVEAIDSYGSLRLSTSPLARPAPVKARVPVEAVGHDSDGVPVYFLLHVVDGFASELEIYKADGSQILSMPPLDEIDLT